VPRFGFISGLFARGGGYAALAERFETSAPPPEPARRNQTVMLDNTVAYRFCVSIAATPAGLYLRPEPKGLGKHPAVLVPWSEVTKVERTRLYWQPAVRLSIGAPKITELNVWATVFEAFRPYLPPVEL